MIKNIIKRLEALLGSTWIIAFMYTRFVYSYNNYRADDNDIAYMLAYCLFVIPAICALILLLPIVFERRKSK